MANQKLELTWIGKNKEPQVEPRILLHDPSKDYGDPNTSNMLIHGDNLLALKALEQQFAGKIKCIYIDPPYNTGSAFEHYDDNLEHSIWLSLMKSRLLLLKELLSEDGIIFVQINDDEAAYLKILLDEIFGRSNYQTTFYIKVRHENRILREDSQYQLVMEQVYCYSKSNKYTPPRKQKAKNSLKDYEYDIEIKGIPDKVEKIGGYDVEIYSLNKYQILRKQKGEGSLKKYTIRGSLITQKGSASEFYELNLRSRREKDGLGTLYRVIGMGKTGDGLGYRDIFQPLKTGVKNGFYFQGKPLKVTESKGLPYPNFYDFTQDFNNAGYEGNVNFRGGKKPEAFLQFLLGFANIGPKDIVLDSFLGSGSTAAVCLKLGINWIGIEFGEHAYTLCKPRLDKVIDGEQSGISETVNWQGGGGYKFYELAPTLIIKDKYGNPVFSNKYNSSMLAAAVAKINGFVYAPDKEIYWKQGYSQGNSYIYVTTQYLDSKMLDSIAEDIDAFENLLICVPAFDNGLDKRYNSINICKIPQSVLSKCEFGVENYNFNIINPPNTDEDELEDDENLEGNEND